MTSAFGNRLFLERIVLKHLATTSEKKKSVWDGFSVRLIGLFWSVL